MWNVWMTGVTLVLAGVVTGIVRAGKRRSGDECDCGVYFLVVWFGLEVLFLACGLLKWGGDY